MDIIPDKVKDGVIDWLIDLYAQHPLPTLIVSFVLFLLFFAAFFYLVIIVPANRKAHEKYTGVLLSSKAGIYPEIQIGAGGPVFRTDDKSGVIFKFVTGAHITIESEEGRLKVSTLIFDRHLKLVAELIKNEWKIAPPPKTWDRNYSNDALEVKDDRGEVVLQVVMVKQRVQLQAVYFVKPEIGFAFIKNPEDADAHMLVFDPAHPIWPHHKRIKPIFKYPSELHLGELVGPDTQ